MHATYEVQFPLFHAQTMMIGLWLVAYLTGVIGIDLVLLTKRRIRARNLFINYLVPFNIIFLYYSFFMLKGVSTLFFCSLIYCYYTKTNFAFMHIPTYLGEGRKTLFDVHCIRRKCYSSHILIS
jgi:predicted membrane-bound mannosyltransferase